MMEHIDLIDVLKKRSTPLRQNEGNPEILMEKEKTEYLSQIDDVEGELRKLGLGFFKICEKKDKDGKEVKTKKGKVARLFIPYRMRCLRVRINKDGYRLQWQDDENKEVKFWGVGITEKEYNAFLHTTSLKKRLNIFLKYQTHYIIRKIKQDKRIMIRLSEDDLVSAQEMARKADISVSELIRRRLRGTIIHEALSDDEKKALKEHLQLAADLKQYGNALNNYMKTTGVTGAQRLDLLFQSQPGTDYAKVLFDAAKKINKLIKH